ncbi:MAG: hypothetical protein JWM27_842 [Gemmatimonadetes bacterium]|nr:hypothetical protein [Gemmatimonadota bacterium]
MPQPIDRLARGYAFLAVLVLYLLFPFGYLSAHPRPRARRVEIVHVAPPPARAVEPARETNPDGARAFLAGFSRDATRHYDPLFTGWLHNVVGMNCESWEEWMRRWLAANAGGRACRVEEAYWGREWTRERWYWPSGHVAMRVTLCDGGKSYYLDPWRFGPGQPAAEKADYESRFGAPDFAASLDVGAMVDARMSH